MASGTKSGAKGSGKPGGKDGGKDTAKGGGKSTGAGKGDQTTKGSQPTKGGPSGKGNPKNSGPKNTAGKNSDQRAKVASKAGRSLKAARGSVVSKKSAPWGTIAAVVVVVILAAGIFGYALYKQHQKDQHAQAMAQWTPSASDQDPSKKIPGVVVKSYPSGKHVQPTQRVAYDQSPPFGGPHDGFWADCDGIVYPKAVRNENMVHALEHGTVWIAYNPDKVTGSALDTLKSKVTGQQFMMLSPYPNLDKPISLQSWGHQLKLDSATDPRIDEFITALRRNQYTYPEVGASCDALGPGEFDPNNPPPFVPPSQAGKNAVPMNGGTQSQTGGNGQEQAPPAAPASK